MMKSLGRNKKLTAWIVILTFLFTCIMPTNIMAGNSIAEAASPVEAPGVTVKLFNYDDSVNNDRNKIQGYNFFDYSGNSVDGNGITNSTYDPVMLPTLVNDYPETQRGSMEYLFNGIYLEETMINGGGLFQKDNNGNYYYDSAKNAAYFNGSDFTLYDQIVYPSYVNRNNTEIQRSNFLPFNEVNNRTATQQGTINGIPAMQLTNKVDLWFGMMVEFEFLMPKDGMVDSEPMVFDFLGDDDVFVYIDDVLVLDIGGTHEAQSGTINFATGAANSPKKPNTNLKSIFQAAGKDVSEFNGNTFADYTVHTLKFFYLERGGTYSYCKLQFNMPTLPEKSLTVEKQLTVDASSEVKDFLEGALDYSFRVLKSDGTVAVPAGEKFVLKQEGKADSEGTVGEEGFFTLKAGQKAEFANMSQYVDVAAGETYYVQEILPEDLRGQYGIIEYVLNGKGGETQTEQNPPAGFEGFLTERLSADQSQYVIYRNAVDTNELSFLQITKTVKDAATSTFAPNREFEMQVKFGGELLPDGTKYSVTGEQGTRTSENGIIKLQANQTATIWGILSGTTYEVKEINADDSNIVYSNEEGEFTLNSVISVIVENESKTINLSGTKYWVDNNNESGKRPGEITVILLADGDEVERITVNGDAKAENWNYTFDNLPKYNQDGVEIVYTVSEEAVKHYTTQIDGMNLLNVIEQKYFDISGSKTWVAPEGTQYPEIVIDLFRDGKAYDTVTLAPGSTEYRFENLESYDLTDGHMYQYQLAERKVNGYVPSYEMYVNGKDRIINITNTYSDEEEFVTISGEKKWIAPEDTVLPTTIIVNLYQNGTVIDEMEVTAEMNWQYRFENLPMYDTEGMAYSYTVNEEPVDGYLSLVVPTANGFDITNTLYVGEVGQFSVSKMVSGGSEMVPQDDTEYGFLLKVKATVNQWDSMKVYQKSELEDARDEALAELDEANEKLLRAEKIFRQNAVAFTTGSAYQFIMTEEVYIEEPKVTTGSAYDYTTGSAYKYTIVDNGGDVLVKHSKSPLFMSFTPAADAADAIERIIEAIKALADDFKNLNKGSVFLKMLHEEQQSSTPSALKFERTAAEDLLQAERDVQEADALVDAREQAIEDFLQTEVATPSAIKIIMTPMAGSDLKPITMELDSSSALYDEETMTYTINFDLLKDTGYVFAIEAVDKAVIEYSISEMDVRFDTYKGTEITVNGTDKLEGRYVALRVLDKASADTYLFNNIYADNPPPYVPPTEPEDPPYIPPYVPPVEPEDPPYVPPYVPPVIPEEPSVTPEEVVVIEEPEVPLGDNPGVEIPGEIIEEEDIPLGDAPPTGDNANAIPFVVMMAFAVVGLVVTRRRFN